ncbi:MAG: diaminopimelate decarboxylase [Candidatus Binatia bacterium]|nr:MAG: diaminopimelate decarboxylase [Candidatus Binatia bacterium]
MTVEQPHGPWFNWKSNELYVEGVSLAEIARQVGTPTYVYSRSALEERFTALSKSLESTRHLICYSVKANSNLAVLRTFARLGSGFDIVSAGELYRVQCAGGSLSSVVYSGVGKTEDEVRAALKAGILFFNAESLAELELLERVAAERGQQAPVALRINPDVDPKTHPYIATGLRKSKFGIPMSHALEAYDYARRFCHLRIVGLDCHIGSQLTDLAPFRDALERIRGLWERLCKAGYEIQYIDVGGGLGIRYRDENPPSFADYADVLTRSLQPFAGTVVLEPGRSLVGNAGALLTRVQYLKNSGEKNFVIVDAAMNDLIRPSLYGAYQEIVPVFARPGEPVTVDVVGPVCESGDFLARDRSLPAVRPGDLLAVMSAGAYGFVMASNYNARPRAAEVLVDGDRFSVVRARETYADLTRGETIPAWLE